jgi:hypothetical protein
MTRDNVPAPVQPPDPAPVAPAPQQPAVSAGLTAAITQGAAQGAAQGVARSITARLVDKFLTNPPDWLRALWNVLPRPWE